MESREIDRLAYRINATNPSQIEMWLSLQPGGPESLEEAVERIAQGEPVVPATALQTDGGQPDPGTDP